MTATIERSAPERPMYPSLAALRLAHSKLLSSFDRNNPSPAVLQDIEEFLQAGRLTGWMLSDEEGRNAAQSILDYWSAVLYRAKRPPPDSALIPFGPPARFADVECPYPGLAPFDAKTRDFFLGRQAVVEEFVAKLKSRRLMVVTGPRGCGKSSLVRAGLLPELQAGALPGSDRWTYIGPFVPGAHPLESLAGAVRLVVQPEAADQAAATLSSADLRGDPRALTERVRQLGPALLFVDQLEDVLPAPGESLDADRTAFIDSLVNLVRAADVACVVIATRTDEAIDPSFRAADDFLTEEARADVPDFGSRELRDAIQLPAELVGVTFEEGVVSDLVRAMIGVPVAPPLLQFVLAALWEKRSGQVITWDTYRAFMWDPRRRRSNAGWAIGRTAQECYDKLASDPAAQAAMKSILVQLIVPIEGAEVLLRRVQVSVLRRRAGAAAVSPEAFDRALRELIDARLLRCSTASEGDDPDDSAVEVIHAALARNWPALDQWLVEVRIEQERRRRLQAATKEWLDHARSEDALWRETLLESIDDQDPHLGTAERDFIAASRSAARHYKRRRMGYQLMALAATLVLVFVAGFGLQAWQTTRMAHSQQLVADSLRTDDPVEALLMTVSAYQLNPDTEAHFSILDQLVRQRQLAAVLGARGQLTATAASSDGAVLAGAEKMSNAGGSQTDVVLWDGVTLTELRRLDMSPVDQNHTVRVLAFDASHARLAAAFDDNRVGIWDTQTGQPLRWRSDVNLPEQMLLIGRQEPPSALAFDARDGHDWLVSIGQDGLVSWELQTGAVARQARIAQRPIVALSPDGTHVVATGCSPAEIAPCSSPRTIRMWDTATAELVWTGLARAAPTGVWFSAQSDLIAFAGQPPPSTPSAPTAQFAPTGQAAQTRPSLTVDVRDAYAPDPVLVSAIPTGPVVRLVADSRSGLLVAATCKLIVGECSRGDDAQVQAFDMRAHAPAGPPMPVAPDGVLGLVLLPSPAPPGNDLLPGLRVAVPQPAGITVLNMQVDRAGIDPLALADDIGGLGPTVVRVGPERVAVLGCVAVSLGAACPAGAVHLVDRRIASPVGQNLVGDPPQAVTSLAATNDGAMLAAGRVNGVIDVWDTSNGERRVSLPAATPSERVSALAFASDGRLAVAAGRALRVWTLDNPQAPRAVALPTQNDQTTALAFSADAALLGAGGADGNLEAWSVAPAETASARGYRGLNTPITSIAFSPDKNLVAAVGTNADNRVLVWEVDSTRLIGGRLLATNLDGVASLAFSLDSRTLTAGDGRNIASWRLDLSAAVDPVRRACQIAHRNLTAAEWKSLRIDPPTTPACREWPA